MAYLIQWRTSAASLSKKGCLESEGVGVAAVLLAKLVFATGVVSFPVIGIGCDDRSAGFSCSVFSSWG